MHVLELIFSHGESYTCILCNYNVHIDLATIKNLLSISKFKAMKFAFLGSENELWCMVPLNR